MLSDSARFSSVEWLTPNLEPPPALRDFVSAEESTLGDAIAFPGLINSHDHLAFSCYSPTGSPPYLDFLAWSRDVQAKSEMIERIERIPYAVRVQFGVLKNLLWGVTVIADHGGRQNCLSLPIAIMRHCTLHSPELEKWASLKLRFGGSTIVAHLAEGVDDASRERALALLRWNVASRPVVGVHCVSLRDADFAKLAALVWCPASNFFLFGRTADIAQAAAHTRVLFGTDSPLSAPGTIWDHIRTARAYFSGEALLSSLTAEAAHFWGLPDSRAADNFVIARRRAASAWDSFYAITPSDILLVVHDGSPALIDSRLVEEIMLPGFEAVTCEGTCKYVKMPLNAMLEAVRSAAPDFDCDALLERFCTGAL